MGAFERGGMAVRQNGSAAKWERGEMGARRNGSAAEWERGKMGARRNRSAAKKERGKIGARRNGSAAKRERSPFRVRNRKLEDELRVLFAEDNLAFVFPGYAGGPRRRLCPQGKCDDDE